MKGTLRFSIDTVYEGYDWIGPRQISDERGWWVRIWMADKNRCRKEWEPTYDELKKRVEDWWGVQLPPKNELHFKNYGEPYNVAVI